MSIREKFLEEIGNTYVIKKGKSTFNLYNYTSIKKINNKKYSYCLIKKFDTKKEAENHISNLIGKDSRNPFYSFMKEMTKFQETRKALLKLAVKALIPENKRILRMKKNLIQKELGNIRKELNNIMDQFKKVRSYISEMIFSSAINNFILFTSNIITITHKIEPKLLVKNEGNKDTQKSKVNLSSLIENEKDELIEEITNKFVRKIMYQNFTNINQFLKSRLKINMFRKRGNNLEKVQHYINIRNLLTHNNGVIDEKFIKNVKGLEKKAFAVGEKITIDKKILKELLDLLINIATDTYEQLIEIYKMK